MTTLSPSTRRWLAAPALVLLSLLPLLPAGAVSAVTFPAQITLEPTAVRTTLAGEPRCGAGPVDATLSQLSAMPR